MRGRSNGKTNQLRMLSIFCRCIEKLIMILIFGIKKIYPVNLKYNL